MKTLNKIKTIFFLTILLSLLFAGCASSKKSQKSVDNAEEVSETTVDNENSSENSKKKKKKKKDKKAKKNKSKESEDKQNYIGWISSEKHPIVCDFGIIRLRAIPALGSFNLGVINEKGKTIPVLSSSNEYASSSFYLSTDKKNYKLTAESKVSTAAKKTDTGMYVAYRIKNVSDVKVDFDCFSSEDGREPDMLKITATVTNLSEKKGKFALKALFDTILGESYRNHFYTSDGLSVKNERIFMNSGEEADLDKWILSKNANAGMQLFLKGNDTSKIEQVQLANFSTLDTQNWYPNLTSYRAFDTVTSYNNSAIGINWPAVALGAGESYSVVFYIALSANEIDPNGLAFINPSENTGRIDYEYYVEDYEEDLNEENNDVFFEEEVPVKEVSVKEVPVKKEQKVETQQIENKNVQKKKTVEKQKTKPEPQPLPEVYFDVTSLTAEQLEPEYIQNLINRITVLEESGLAVNRAELLQLNAELDAILEILRKN